ncbi:MAG: hypothetical protein IKG17_01050 [Mogibacterium sp.]|nr:hypothetical protein [Mogibacterium sp.]
MDLREVIIIHHEQESIKPKHYKADSSEPKHLRKKSAKPKILKILITVELLSVILACCYVYRIWCHNFEMRVFGQVCTATLTSASGRMDDQTENAAKESLKSFMEAVVEEIYEYAWVTEKTEYRVGADMSYRSAGTLEKDNFVRLTGTTRNGWSRISVDDKEYYIPEDKASTDTPEGLPIAAGRKGEYQKYALSLLPDFGWDASELEPLIYLWNRESGWNPNSHNKRSGAHGIPQALPGSKMASEGSDYYTNAEPQIRWGLKYIARRYGSPSAAWAHFQSRGWY